MKKVHQNKSLWLITCSDLFFLLVAFFVLNHKFISERRDLSQAMIEEPVLEESREVFKLEGAHDVRPRFGHFSQLQAGAQEEISYVVENSWFEESGEVTILGDTHLKTVKNLAQSDKTKIVAEIMIPEIVNTEDLDQLSILYAKLENYLPASKLTVLKTDAESSEPKLSLFIMY